MFYLLSSVKQLSKLQFGEFDGRPALQSADSPSTREKRVAVVGQSPLSQQTRKPGH